MTALTDALTALQADVVQVGQLNTSSRAAQIKAAQAKLKTDVAALATAVNPTPPPPPPPPAANQVTNLTATATAPGEITVNGTPPSPAPSGGYTIARDGTDTTGAGPWSGDVPSGPPWKFDKLLDATTYNLTVTPEGGVAALIAGTTSGSAPTPPPPVPGNDPVPTKALLWTGAAGSFPSASLVTPELGGGGWGNNELETYTDRASNAYVDGKGNLVIVAKRETYTNPKDGITRDFTSARFNTQRLFLADPGSYNECTMILSPNGWAAWWTIGEDAYTQGVPWPDNGEIDMVEITGGHAFSNAHVKDNVQSGWGYPGADMGPVDGKTPVRFGVYFDANAVTFFRDRKKTSTWTKDQTQGRPWPFNQRQYFLFNIAVAGSDTGFPGCTATYGPVLSWNGALGSSALPALS